MVLLSWALVSELIQIPTADFQDHLERSNWTFGCQNALVLVEKVIKLSKNLLEAAANVLEAKCQNRGQKHGLRTVFHVGSGELELCEDVSHSVLS